MRRKSPPRVVGPYLERGKWRIVVVENNERKSFFLTEQDAPQTQGGLYHGEVATPTSRTLADVLAEWNAHRLRTGSCKPHTATGQSARMRLMQGRIWSETSQR